MIIKNNDKEKMTELSPENGFGRLEIEKLFGKYENPQKIRTFAKAVLEPNSKVGFHVHTGECEIYHILSGRGIYNDNQKEYEICAGDTTYTKSGEGHAIENTSQEPLEFIALIIKD